MNENRHAFLTRKTGNILGLLTGRKSAETLDFPEKNERAAPCGAAAKFRGANGDRTHDLSRVRRTLIPAELWLLIVLSEAFLQQACRMSFRKRKLHFSQHNV